MKNIIVGLLLCCILCFLIVPISKNINPDYNITIGELNQTEEVGNLSLVNETVILSPISVVSIPKYKFVNASPIVIYSVEDFSWVWVDDVTILPNKSTYQKKLMNISKLENDIEEAPYQTYELKQDRFDCSNTAGMLVDHLNSRGWDAAIVVGDSKKSSRCVHAFVIVDRRIIVEPTLKVITYAEGKKDNMKDLNFYVNTWDIIGFYYSKEDAIKRSRWSYNEWDDLRF